MAGADAADGHRASPADGNSLHVAFFVVEGHLLAVRGECRTGDVPRGFRAWHGGRDHARQRAHVQPAVGRLHEVAPVGRDVEYLSGDAGQRLLVGHDDGEPRDLPRRRWLQLPGGERREETGRE